MIQHVPENWNVPQYDQHHDVQLDANTIVFNLPTLIQTSELMWDTGGEPNPIDLHGDGSGRANGNPPPPRTAVGGTLESVVNQSAAFQPPPPPPPATSKSGRRRHVPWSRRAAARASSDSSSLQAVPVAVDTLVPCNNSTNKGGPGSYGTWSATQGGSCSTAAEKGYPRGSTTTFDTESRQLTVETGDLEMVSHGFTFTSNSIGSLGNTSSAANQTANNDSASHSINERDGEDDKSKIKGKTSQVSVKKNRAAAVHNQSERKRRDRINEKMKTLQKMVPNASKTDKASMLDEVIDYLKNLQAQINLMTRMPSIMMQQQLQLMSMMGMGMNMGLAGMAGMTGAGGPMAPPPNMAAGNVLPPYMNPFMSPSGWEGIIGHGSEVPMQIVPTGLEAPVPNPFNVFLARQQAEAPNAMESAARMTALYQQYQQFQQVHGA